MSNKITVTTEHNTQPRGGKDEIRWICLKVKAEQDEPTEAQRKKNIRPKPIPDRTVVNIGIVDHSDKVLARKLHEHLTKATREFVETLNHENTRDRHDFGT